MMRRFWILTLAMTLTAAFLAGRDPAEVRRAVRGLCERAAAGDSKSQYDLARLHETGYDSIRIDTLRAVALYRMAAESGYARAQSYLGSLYFVGKKVRQDTDSANYWFHKAMDAGDPRAANNLGYLLITGDSAKRDYEKARSLFEIAASQGLTTAQAQLADLFREGLGGPTDTIMAYQLYLKASEGGLEDAQRKLISMMEKRWEALSTDSALSLGKSFYPFPAPEAGVKLLEIAADGGNSEAMRLLGEAFSIGHGAPYNHNLSEEYFLKGALNGNTIASRVIAELLEVFPDALHNPRLESIIQEFFSPDPIPSDVYSAQYWLERSEE